MSAVLFGAPTRSFAAVLLALVTLGAPMARAASWELDGGASSLGFVTVKNGTIAEGHQFTGLSGSVVDGKAKLVIDLASVDTSVPVRDERMRDLLFQVATYPQAVFSADVGDLDLGIGESREQDVAGTLAIHGVTAPVSATVRVTRDADGRVTVASTKPVVVGADALSLGEGVAKLKEVAGLASITPMVPVAFTLSFVPTR